MALKAGYYGVKKQILDELKKLDGILPAGVSKVNKLATQSEINDIWAVNRVLGAANLFKNTASSKEASGSVYTVNTDGSVQVSGTASAQTNLDMLSPNNFEAGTYKVNCTPEGGADGSYWAVVRKGGSSGTVLGTDFGNGVVITLEEADKINIRLLRGASETETRVFKPMITLDISASYNDFVPYAMTNQELTESAADQKTAINAIITAATEAADFAAFKTAMGAITPVTRSIQTVPDEVREDPEPETRSTKKSTKKTTE